ncbi:MAG: DUF2784 domain-containing protein [Betaproteobacteria bacterium]|nr:DUF2784 domain-containing protein [Betaproteobacteria bacterium]
MLYRIGAGLVLLAHFLFVAFAVLGGALAYYSPTWPWVHVPVVLWSAVVNFMSWTCPLTPMENALRNRAGRLGYSGGFVEHYIGPLVYPRGMPRQLELVAGVSILAWNALVYAVVVLWAAR